MAKPKNQQQLTSFEHGQADDIIKQLNRTGYGFGLATDGRLGDGARQAISRAAFDAGIGEVGTTGIAPDKFKEWINTHNSALLQYLQNRPDGQTSGQKAGMYVGYAVDRAIELGNQALDSGRQLLEDSRRSYQGIVNKLSAPVAGSPTAAPSAYPTPPAPDRLRP